MKEVEKSTQRDEPSESSNESTSYSADIMDEMLIDAVEQRPSLWNQKLPVQRRSPSIRRELWDEVFNNLGNIYNYFMFYVFMNVYLI